MVSIDVFVDRIIRNALKSRKKQVYFLPNLYLPPIVVEQVEGKVELSVIMDCEWYGDPRFYASNGLTVAKLAKQALQKRGLRAEAYLALLARPNYRDWGTAVKALVDWA